MLKTSNTRVAEGIQIAEEASAITVNRCYLLPWSGALLFRMHPPVGGDLMGGDEAMLTRQTQPQVEVDGGAFVFIKPAYVSKTLRTNDSANGCVQPIIERFIHGPYRRARTDVAPN